MGMLIQPSRFCHLGEDSVAEKQIVRSVECLSSMLKSKRRKGLTTLSALAEDPTSRTLMVQSGAVKRLIKMLLKHDQGHSNEVLHILCSIASNNSDARKEMMAAQIVELVVPFAASRSSFIKSRALCLLYFLSIEVKGLYEIAGSGIPEEIIPILGIGESEYEEWAVRLAGNLVQGCPAILLPIIKADSIEQLLDRACTCGGHMKTHIFQLLTSILEASPDSNLAACLCDKGVAVLLEALTPISGDRECGEWAIRTLSAVSLQTECQKSIVGHAGVRVVVQMLWDSSDIVIESALRIILNLTEIPEGIGHLLSKALDIIPIFLCAESPALQELSARALARITAMQDKDRLNVITAGVVRNLFSGLNSSSRCVRLSFLEALNQLNCDCELMHTYVSNCRGIEMLAELCSPEPLDFRMLELSLALLRSLWAMSNSHQAKFLACSGARHLLALCKFHDEHNIVMSSLQLLTQLAATDIGLSDLVQALNSDSGWEILSIILQQGMQTWKRAVLQLIEMVISGTKGEIHLNLLEQHITWIVGSITNPDSLCQQIGACAIVALVESSPVYCAQVVSSGAVPLLVHLVNSGNPEVANPASRALGEIALGGQEHQDLIEEAKALPALLCWLLCGDAPDELLILEALCLIVEDHDRNCRVFSASVCEPYLINKINEAVNDEASYAAVLLTVVCRTQHQHAMTFLNDNILVKVLIVLSSMSKREWHWKNHALFGLEMLIESNLAEEKDIEKSIDELLMSMYQSTDEEISHRARMLICQTVNRHRHLNGFVKDADTRLLVHFLKSSEATVCEQALDLLLAKSHDNIMKAQYFCETGGVQILVTVMIFGTNVCKTKAALLVSDLGQVSHNFSAEALQCGIVKPLIALLAMDDTNCRAAALGALTFLLGKDIVDLQHAERVQIITEVLNSSRGGQLEEAAGLMRSIDALNIASTGCDNHLHDLQADSSDSEANIYNENESPSSQQDCLLCPITHELMINPVLAADGHVYEREAIETWLSGHSTSPMTNLELPGLTLIPIDNMELQIARLSS